MVEKPARKQKRGTATTGAGTRKSAPHPRRTVASGAPGIAPTVVGAEERHRMIAVAAYLRAERRGFGKDSSEQDWLEAEAEIDRMLASPGTARKR